MLRSLGHNLPHRKPELWRALPGALLRQIRLRSGNVPRFATAHMPNGIEIEVDSCDPMGKAIYLYGCYEYEVTKLVRRLVKPDSVVFDVGANIGYYTLLTAPRAKQVVAFEPVDEIFERLASNVQHNRLSNVKLLHAAAGSYDGKGLLSISGSENTGLSSLEEIAGARKQATDVVTLDRITRELDLVRVGLIKIDIEGAEVRAFEGGRELLSRKDAPDVIFESHPGSEAAAWLKRKGYNIYSFRRQREYEAPNLFASKRALPANVAKRLQPLP